MSSGSDSAGRLHLLISVIDQLPHHILVKSTSDKREDNLGQFACRFSNVLQWEMKIRGKQCV